MFIPSVRRPLDINAPPSIAAAIAIGIIGSLALPFLPMTVGVLTDELGFTQRQVGLLASADMAGMLLGNIGALFWVRHRYWRWITVCMTLTLLAAHATTTVLTLGQPTLLTLLGCRIAAGAAGGAMMAIGATAIGDTLKREKNIALWTASQSLVSAAAFLLMPTMVARYGAAGVFGMMTCLALLAILFVPLLAHSQAHAGRPFPIGESLDKGDAAGMTAANIRLALLATLPGLLFHMGYSAIWTYVERIGIAAGLTLLDVSRAIAMALIVAITGGLSAFFLATRWGYTIPLVITLTLQVTAIALLSQSQESLFNYTVALMLFTFCLNFPIPYHLGIALTIDRSGRTPIFYLIMLKIGVAITPSLVSIAITPGNYLPALLGGVVFFTLCFLHLLLLIFLMHSNKVSV